MSRTLTTAASFAGTVLGFVLLALVLLGPGSGSAADASPTTSAPAFTPVAEQPAELEESFLADLFGPDTDLSPEHSMLLTELAQRYCTTVVRGEIPPGAEVQTREGWIETFTMPAPSLTTGWSEAEATKFLDAAEATFCPMPAGAEQNESL